MPEAAQLRGRRAKAALKVAFVIAMRFLTFRVVFGGFGFMIWLRLFVPALLGILWVQFPMKLLASRWQWRGAARYGAVVAATIAVAVGLAVLTAMKPSVWGIAGLIAAATVAASIWQAIDARALSGPALRYSQGSYHA